MNKVMFWDFDGTLGGRPNLFSGSLRMVMDEFESGHSLTDEDFKPWIQEGYPWHEPEKDFLDFREPENWWEKIFKLMEKAYVMNGVDPVKAGLYVRESRKYIIDTKYFSLFDDTIETLRFFKENGYRNIIVSNHIPELPEIVHSLGLSDYIETCITSALVGYEKPHPGIYRIAMETAGNPDEVWMVGDNIIADVRGAENFGIRGILVRKQTEEPIRYYSPDLLGVIDIVRVKS